MKIARPALARPLPEAQLPLEREPAWLAGPADARDGIADAGRAVHSSSHRRAETGRRGLDTLHAGRPTERVDGPMAGW